jgi:hypothetical protein
MTDNVRGNFYRQVLGVKRVEYTRRVPNTGRANTRFRIRIRVVLYSGRIRVIPEYCSFGFGSDTEQELPRKYPDIRVGYGYPEFGYPFFLFLHNIVIKS